ncbi:MAG: hypothetical protein ACREA4_11810, partial [Nitrososphaera sp.]
QLLPAKAPGKDTLVQLAESFDNRHIWRAVVATHIGFPDPFPCKGKWQEKVQWVTENPEDYDEMLYRADDAGAHSGKVRLVLFDALDRLADDWPRIRPLARALLQVALDLRAYRSIRAKLFVRPDMLEDREVLAFPDSSKLLARKVALTWRRVDLYALLFQCLGNPPTSGEAFRNHCHQVFSLVWDQDAESKAWILPHALRTEEDVQRDVFHAIAGPAMASGPSGHKRGFPYTWLPNHLLDGRDQVSPRSYCAALRHAAMLEVPEEWLYPLHYKAIQTGVQEASRIRINEIREDYRKYSVAGFCAKESAGHTDSNCVLFGPWISNNPLLPRSPSSRSRLSGAVRNPLRSRLASRNASTSNLSGRRATGKLSLIGR